MKSFQLVLLCLICVAKSYGQTLDKNYYCLIDVEFTKEKRSKKLHAKVDMKSDIPRKDSAWLKSIERNINLLIEDDNRIKKGKYVVSAKFIVSKDGSLSDIACGNDPGFGMCDVVLRVLKKTKNWVPAEQRGKVVREYRKG